MNKILLRNTLLTLTATAVAHSTLIAQTTPATAPDTAAVARQIDTLKMHVDARERRVKEYHAEIIRLDERVERGVAEILKHLESVSDTKDSKTKIIRMKQEVIEALAKTIRNYQMKRRELAGQMLNPNADLSVEDMEKGVAVFDEKVEKRIQQILELNRTISGSGEFSRYVDTYKKDGFNRYKRSSRENPNYRQALRTNTQADQTKRELAEALGKSIDRIDADNARLTEMLKNPGYTSQQQQLIQEEITRNQQFLDTRHRQLESEVQSFAPTGSGVSISEAMDMDRMLKDAGNDLERDFYSIFTNYNLIVVEKKKITHLERMIQEREALSKVPLL